MSALDGKVKTTTKIVDHGSSDLLWDIAIIGDGYQESELSKYHDHVQKFVDRLRVTVPFDELFCGINIHRIDVASTDSGASEPATCGGTTGTAKTLKTFFDARFCFDGNTRRLLVGTDATALAVSSSQVPQRDVTVVIVNTSDLGGGGGGAAWASAHADAGDIAIHEIGHSFFNLADEYDDITNTHTGGEPREPNVTINTNPATIKWRSLILPGNVPRSSNPDCTKESPSSSPFPAGTVGLFEGAKRTHCGIFRPEFECKMRDHVKPFCAVCRQVIRQRLLPNFGDFIDCATVTLRRVSGNKFVSTKVIHAIDFRLSSRAETATDIFIRSNTNGFLRADLDAAIPVPDDPANPLPKNLPITLIKDIEVND